MRVKDESEKVGLKLNIQKTKIMASAPNISQQIDREKAETMTDFIFLGFKITTDNNCSHKIKKWLLLGRKAKTNLDSVLKTRHHFADKCLYSQSYGFPVVMYECEKWTIKKSECLRIDAFKLWYWRRLLRVPWTARRSNLSILKEITLGRSLEGLMLKLKLQYFGHLRWKADSLEKTLVLGKIEGKSRRGQQRMRRVDGITNSMGMNLSKLQEIEKEAWWVAVYKVTKCWTQLSDWITTIDKAFISSLNVQRQKQRI